MKQIRVDKRTHEMLEELSQHNKDNHIYPKSFGGIISVLIQKELKRVNKG